MRALAGLRVLDALSIKWSRLFVFCFVLLSCHLEQTVCILICALNGLTVLRLALRRLSAGVWVAGGVELSVLVERLSLRVF